MTYDIDTLLPTPSQVSAPLHMLAVSIPFMSAVFGACLRVALSYHQLFHRLDPFLFRLLVGILLVLTTGQVACITAETLHILKTITEGREDLGRQRIINAFTQVFTTAIALVCQGFYIERLFATTKNILVRAISIALWMLSISLFIAWNVKYLLHNGPHLNGERKYDLGAASLWALAVATAFVSTALIYSARQRRLRSAKSSPPLSPSSRLYQIVSLSIQTFSLVTLNHLASAIGFTSSLSTSSNATAACVAFFFFNLFPGLSTYSIIHTLNQRKIEMVQQESRNRRGRGRWWFGKKRDSRLVKGKQKEEAGAEKEQHGIGIASGMTAAEDDPSNWRGDSSLTNSSVAPIPGGGGIHSATLMSGSRGGGEVSRSRQPTPSGPVDSEERGGDLRRIDFLDRFDEYDSDMREEDSYPWGIEPTPFPPLDDVGIGLNWDALEECRPRQAKR
ncbi:uncharacterized protein JCM6883_001865 [Sporobolomyces salmoneus]|uniref:uncharacterized protein n=1 Tax=Sporobolomyces salmoneus TaxID=183962 RepID=UPI00317C3E34